MDDHAPAIFKQSNCRYYIFGLSMKSGSFVSTSAQHDKECLGRSRYEYNDNERVGVQIPL